MDVFLASPSARRHSYSPGPITRARLLRLLHRSSPNTASSLPLPSSSFPSPSSSLRPSSTSALNRRRAATCLRPQCEAAGERSPSGPAQCRRRPGQGHGGGRWDVQCVAAAMSALRGAAAAADFTHGGLDAISGTIHLQQQLLAEEKYGCYIPCELYRRIY